MPQTLKVLQDEANEEQALSSGLAMIPYSEMCVCQFTFSCPPSKSRNTQLLPTQKDR